METISLTQDEITDLVSKDSNLHSFITVQSDFNLKTEPWEGIISIIIKRKSDNKYFICSKKDIDKILDEEIFMECNKIQKVVDWYE